MRRPSVCVCVLLPGIPLMVCAQAKNGSDLTEVIQALSARMDQLERRVAELEANSGNAVRLALASEPGEAMPTYPALKLAGFSDFSFLATDQGSSRRGFTEGQFTLHFKPGQPVSGLDVVGLAVEAVEPPSGRGRARSRVGPRGQSEFLERVHFGAQGRFRPNSC